MSANNQLIIKRRKKNAKWDIFMNHCADNDFTKEDTKKENKLKTETSLIKAIKWCNDYMSKNIVEYGYYVVTAHSSSVEVNK